ncbi:MAG: ABC transporter permease [Acidobacteria bacterium]|nr:ABC transporter permease [Acidobacteriota bacterium]
MGGLAQAKEAYREQRGLPILETTWRDIRFGTRALRRTPGVSVAVIATLAVGIGANTAIFSLVYGVLLKPLPYPRADALISIAHATPGANIETEVPSAPYLYFTYREANRTLDGVGLWRTGSVSVTGLDRPEQVQALLVTSEILPILGVPPLLGRQLSPHDDSPGSPLTVMLTHGYWQRRFGADASMVGRRLLIDGEPRDVIGVMPPAFRFLDQPVDVIFPFQLDRNQVTLGRYVFPSLARLKVGVSLADATADLARMVPLAVETFPPPPGYTRERFAARPVAPHLRPLKEEVVGDVGRTLWLLMTALGLVLLIVCANVANLLLVRTEGRRQEVAVRAALGASWRRIASELLIESMLLGVMGGIAGLALAELSLRLLVAFAPDTLPRLAEIAIDPVVVLFTLAISLVAGAIFGLILVVKYANPGLAMALRGDGRTMSDSRETHRTRAALVVVQVTMALVLLVCSGLMIRTFQALSHVDPGFSHPDQVQLVHVAIPFTGLSDEHATRMQQAIVDGIRVIPGVADVAFADIAPLAGGNFSDTVLFAEGKTYSEGQPRPLRRFEFISPSFFQTLGVPIVEGRDLTWVDLYDKRMVALISAGLARDDWGTPAQALGKRVRAGPADPWREIVGVVGDVHDNGVDHPAPPIVYFPARMDHFWGTPTMSARDATFLIRSPRAGSESLVREIEAAIWGVNANLPLAQIRTLADAYRKSLARTSFTLTLLVMAGVMGLLLGFIGIYGVIAYGVSQRTREIGIRLALGAQPGELRGRFVRAAMILAAVGAAAGLAIAVVLTRAMSSLLFGVSPVDPVTYAAVTAIVLATARLAAHLPARRATSHDPIDALRQG